MLVSDFDYFLPAELIAQTPVESRTSARLLVYQEKNDQVNHQHINDMVEYLNAGDVLVINDSKVFPARLIGKRKSSEAQVEVFLIHEINDSGEWQVLVKMNRPKADDEIMFGADFFCKLIKADQSSTWLVQFNVSGDELWQLIEKYGQTPLPPYIHQPDTEKVRQRYQTVFAGERGSVAAPTAGLHFTDELLAKLTNNGVKIVKVTLHVGIGTFQPVKTETVEDHKLHAEWAMLSQSSAEIINQAKKNGSKIIAVGTTSVRVLEAWSDENGFVQPQSAWLNIFIYPGYKFKCVDYLLTNFHLPKSSLLMLVSAFIGRDKILELYQQAVQQKYRFYSFGDAMLLVKK